MLLCSLSKTPKRRVSSARQNTTEDEVSYYEILPPPETVYPSHDDAESALHEWTLQHGFNVSRRRARWIGSVRERVWARNYVCNRAGALPHPPGDGEPTSPRTEEDRLSYDNQAVHFKKG